MRPTIPTLTLTLAFTLAFAFLATTFPLRAAADTVSTVLPALMPMPAKMEIAPKRWVADSPAPMTVSGAFKIGIFGAAAQDERVRAAVIRLLQRWGARTGLTFDALAPDGTLITVAGVNTLSPPGSPVVFSPVHYETNKSIQTLTLFPLLVITATAAAPALPALGEDESYSLDVTTTCAQLSAPTTTGVLRGLATLTQLLQQNAGGFSLPNCAINDSPRFPWRGLMLDCARHWMPVDVIKRQLDGMELVKLNVLHLHLSDDQGFRVESKTHPELQQKGSDGHYFTQEQIREIIRYATARAIRVVPEFDMPGHAASWSPSHPELMSGPPHNAGDPPPKTSPPTIWDGTCRVEHTWCIFDMVFNPANEATYTFLDEFLGEMAALFPDPCLHTGGDETNGVQWNANPDIQKFIADNHLKNNASLQAYFTNRVGKILAAHGKKLVGWEEILHAGLAPDSVIHAWRDGKNALVTAAKAGRPVILSAGYYLDLNLHAADHYLIDPFPAAGAGAAAGAGDGTPLTPAEQKNVLGGEAAMWAEWATPEILDQRIWPRAAAVAERLWSPQSLRDTDDMYRRLDAITLRLDEAGLQHIRNRAALLQRLAGDRATPAQLDALRIFAEALEPVKRYQRRRLDTTSTQQTPLVGLVDAIVTDSASARAFNANVAAYLEVRKSKTGPSIKADTASKSDPANRTAPEQATQLLNEIAAQLERWQSAAETTSALFATLGPRLKPEADYARGVVYACQKARIATDVSAGSTRQDRQQATSVKATAYSSADTDIDIDKATNPNASSVEFPALAGINQLIDATREPSSGNVK